MAEPLIEQRELDSPLAEVTAHAVLYELPLLSRLYARTQALYGDERLMGDRRESDRHRT